MTRLPHAAVLAAVAAGGATTGRLWPCCQAVSLPWANAIGTMLVALGVWVAAGRLRWPERRAP